MSTVERIDQYLARHELSTPCVIIHLETVRQRCATLRTLLPNAHVYYAVKANPAGAVISALANQGIGFDLASAGEIDRCLQLGIPTDRFCFGNTIKRESDIARAHALGIDLFAFDSPMELEKLARAAPGARVFCRLSVHGRGQSGRSRASSVARHRSPSNCWCMPKRSAFARLAHHFMWVLSKPIPRSGQPPLVTPHAYFTAVTGRVLCLTCLMSAVVCRRSTARLCPRSRAMSR
jgi:hypothetical protein